MGRKPRAAFGREPVLLIWARWFVGNGAFQPAGFDQRFKVGFAEMFAVSDVDRRLKRIARLTCFDFSGGEHLGDLRGSLRGGLRGRDAQRRNRG